MCSGTEVGSYLRLVDSCITQLKAQGPSRTCNESKEEEEEEDMNTGGALTDHAISSSSLSVTPPAPAPPSLQRDSKPMSDQRILKMPVARLR